MNLRSSVDLIHRRRATNIHYSIFNIHYGKQCPSVVTSEPWTLNREPLSFGYNKVWEPLPWDIRHIVKLYYNGFNWMRSQVRGCGPNWSVGTLEYRPPACRACASERRLGMKSGKRSILQKMLNLHSLNLPFHHSIIPIGAKPQFLKNNYI